MRVGQNSIDCGAKADTGMPQSAGPDVNVNHTQKRIETLRRQLVNGSQEEDIEGPQLAYAVVIGAAICDIQAQAVGRELEGGGTVPGVVQHVLGGVGRNIAHALAQLCMGWLQPFFITMLGDDISGQAIRDQWQKLGLPSEGLVASKAMATPSVVFCLNQDGSVAAGVAALSAFEANFRPAVLLSFRHQLQATRLIILDGNLPPAVLAEAVRIASCGSALLWFEPVSTAKAVRAIGILDSLDFVSPNALELIAMAKALQATNKQEGNEQMDKGFEQIWAEDEALNLLPYAQPILQAGAKHVVVTLGAQGAALYQRMLPSNRCQVTHMPALPTAVKNTNGAGDCLVAGCCMRLLQGGTPVAALAFGIAAASLAVQSETNVPSSLEYGRVAGIAKQVLRLAKSQKV